MGGDTWVPFTIDQWQELELQALVFKYLILSEPVPLNLVRLVCKLVDPPAVLPAQYLARDREEQLRSLQRSIGEEAEAKRQSESCGCMRDPNLWSGLGSRLQIYSR